MIYVIPSLPTFTPTYLDMEGEVVAAWPQVLGDNQIYENHPFQSSLQLWSVLSVFGGEGTEKVEKEWADAELIAAGGRWQRL